MTFGHSDWGSGEEEARSIYAAFRDAGGNFLDTANEVYAEGRSEEIVGRLVAGHRDEMVIATKFGFQMPGGRNVNAAGNHRKSLIRSVDASLKRMGTDYIDILWLHCWDETTPQEEVLRALDDLVAQGKILHIGASNFPAWVVASANTLAAQRGWTGYSGLQLEYNLLERAIEREHLPMAKAGGITVCAWSPLAGGILSGKYNRSEETGNRRAGNGPVAAANEHNAAVALELYKIAHEIGATAVTVALNWLRDKAYVIPVLGARTLAQFTEQLRCLEFSLDPEQMARLDALSPLQRGYPYDFISKLRAFHSAGFQDLIDNPAYDEG